MNSFAVVLLNLLIRHLWGDWSAGAIVWCLVAIIGIGVNSRGLRDAFRERKVINKLGLNGALKILIDSHIETEITRIIISMLFLGVGINSGTTAYGPVISARQLDSHHQFTLLIFTISLVVAEILFVWKSAIEERQRQKALKVERQKKNV